MNAIAVVMAGGLGARLWPRSTEKKPKQFVHVVGDGTMIQNTVMRLMPFLPPERIFVVTTDDLAPHVLEQLPVIPPDNVIREPFGRNTAPALALSATLLRERFGDDVVLFAFPSDHMIYNVRDFQATLDLAYVAAASNPCIVTIGVMPTRPETGFGYIQLGEDVVTDDPILQGQIKHAYTFAEKPDAATAQRFIDAGDFVWNSGIFVSTIHALRQSVDRYMPDHAPLFHQLERHIGKDTYPDVLENTYRQIRSISFDIGVMEKADNVFVVEGSFGWSDVGSWDELYRLLMKDGKNNVIEGNVVTVDTANCLVSGSTGRMIGLVGVDNLIVVETEGSIMICPRGDAEQVRDLVDLMRRRQITRHL